LIEVESRLHPPKLRPDRLRSLTGRYNDIEVKLENGELWMARANRPARKLVPLTTDGLFGLDGIDMLRVRIKSDALETFWKGDPTPRTYPRQHG